MHLLHAAATNHIPSNIATTSHIPHSLLATGYIPHSIATTSYIPIVYNEKKRKEEEHHKKCHTNDSDVNYAEDVSKKKKISWVLSGKEISSLIVSALIFLSVFAWVDVLASYYRDRVINGTIKRKNKSSNSYNSNDNNNSNNDNDNYNDNNVNKYNGNSNSKTNEYGDKENFAGVMAPRFPHRVPQEIVERTMDLDLKGKIGYAVTLSLISITVLILLSLR